MQYYSWKRLTLITVTDIITVITEGNRRNVAWRLQSMENIKAGKNNLQPDFTDGYIGTYFSEGSRGIYHFAFNEANGEMTQPELFFEARDAKWVSLYGNWMTFPIQEGDSAGICFARLLNGRIVQTHKILEERYTPCFVAQEDELVFTANYHEGTVMIYRVETGKPSVAGRIENGEKAGCHQILFHKSYFLVPCLEQNRIRIFHKSNGFRPAGEISFPKGTGPRHGVFNGAHTKFYVVSEWSNELFIYDVNGLDFRLVQSVYLLPERNSNAAAAAVRLTEDERFLYVSVRGVDLLVTVDVSSDRASVTGRVSSGGIHPRDFILSRNERFLLTVNRKEGGIVCMERNRENGEIEKIISHVQLPEGVSLLLA